MFANFAQYEIAAVREAGLATQTGSQLSLELALQRSVAAALLADAASLLESFQREELAGASHLELHAAAAAVAAVAVVAAVAAVVVVESLFDSAQQARPSMVVGFRLPFPSSSFNP